MLGLPQALDQWPVLGVLLLSPSHVLVLALLTKTLPEVKSNKNRFRKTYFFRKLSTSKVI